jgi:hypothetical protein
MRGQRTVLTPIILVEWFCKNTLNLCSMSIIELGADKRRVDFKGMRLFVLRRPASKQMFARKLRRFAKRFSTYLQKSKENI